MTDALYLSERQLAERWGVGPTTVRRLRARGRLRYFQPTPGRVFYLLADVEQYERDETHEAVTVTLTPSRRRLASNR